MIEAYTGMPGSGKTFALTHRAFKALKKKRKVFSNYPIRGAYQITFDDLVEYSFPPNSLVIIDESGRWFNSRSWSKLPPEVFDLFTLHRHANLDLLIAVQNFARIDIALREVVELVWWARNISLSPYFIYYGYYDVEQMGMKGKHDVLQLIPKFSRSKKMYDTHIMKKIFDEKNTIPEKPWIAKASSGSPQGDRLDACDQFLQN